MVSSALKAMAAGRLTGHGDVAGITAELADIALHSAQRRLLVHQPVVAGRADRYIFGNRGVWSGLGARVATLAGALVRGFRPSATTRRPASRADGPP